MNCSKCGAPEREMWTPSSNQPDWVSVKFGNWIKLGSCLDCDRMWCVVPHEPYASFPYAVLWQYSVNDWIKIHDLDEAKTLHTWHIARLQELRSTATDQDEKEIEWHQKRSFGRTPFDKERVGVPNLEKLINPA
jgi:hypothetical protein